MGKFEFRKHGILLDIEGVQVTVPATVEYAKRLEDAGEKMRAFGAQLKEEKDVEKGIDFMLDILDDLLGEDMVDAITAERDVDIYDCLDLVMYISQEVQTYHAERANSYKKPVPQSTQPSTPMAQAAVENRAATQSQRTCGKKKEMKELLTGNLPVSFLIGWQGIPHLL